MKKKTDTDIISKQQLKIEKVKNLEIFEDGDLEKFEELLNSNLYEIEDILNLRNFELRTPLHIACRFGYLEMVQRLVGLHRKYNISLDPKDKVGQTPLLLACCYANQNFNFDALNFQNSPSYQETIKSYKQMLKNRFYIVKTLLNGRNTKLVADIRESNLPNQNTPLHWAIYNGDYWTGKLLFKYYPIMIFKQNENGYTPLELPIRKNLRKSIKQESDRLTTYILQTFVTRLLSDKNQDFDVTRNANEEEKAFFYKLISKFKYKDDNKFKLKHIVVEQIKKQNQVAPDNNSEQMSLIDASIEQYGEDEERQQKSKEQLITLADRLKKLNLDNLKEETQKRNKKIQIYCELDKLAQSSDIQFLHKLLLIATKLKEFVIVEILIENFKTSPFYRTINQENAFSYACLKHHHEMIQKFLGYQYEYEEGFIFEWGNVLNRKVGFYQNTALHNLAYKSWSKDIPYIQQLMSLGADPFLFNYQDHRALDFMNNDEDSRKFRKDYLDRMENQKIEETFPNILELNTFNQEVIQWINEDFQYIIIGRDVESDYRKTLIYDQLKNLQQRFCDLERTFFNGDQKINSGQDLDYMINIRYIKPVDFQDKGVYRHYFLLMFHDDLISQMATYLNFQMYNNKLKYSVSYSHINRKNFDNFRDFHTHQIIHFILNREFDVEILKTKKIIESAFPLHEFRTRNNIMTNWKIERASSFFDPWKIHLEKKDLSPFNSVAFYFGCDLALYVSFTVFWTSFLIILAFFGLIYFIIVYCFQDIDQDSKATLFYALSVIFCCTWIYERWKQRENVHAFIWNTEHSKDNELEQNQFEGYYAIDHINRKIKKKSLISSLKKRLYYEVPLIAVGIALVILSFSFTIVYQVRLDDWTEEDTVDQRGPLTHQQYIMILSGAIGAINGTAIVIFTEVYKIISKIIIKLENHRYKTDEENSFIFKTFVFNFFMNYFNIFFYAFYLEDFAKVSLNYATIVISRNALFIAKSNILPWFLHRFFTKKLLKKWPQQRIKVKQNLLMEFKGQSIANQKFQEFSFPHDLSENLRVKFDSEKEHYYFEYTNKEDEIQDPYKDFEKQHLDAILVEVEKCKYNTIKYESLTKEQKEQLFELEKQLILQDQVELTACMPDAPDQIEMWMNNVIQYGFMAYFSLSFPLMTIYGLIINIAHVHMIYKQMTTILRRRSSLEQSNIGIWKGIVKFITMSSVMFNIAIILLSSEAFEELLNQIAGDSYSEELKYLVLLLIEHVIYLLMLVMLRIIKNKPQWLREEYKYQEYKKNLAISIAKQQELNVIKQHSFNDRQKKRFPKLQASLTKENLGDDEEVGLKSHQRLSKNSLQQFSKL